MRVICQRLIDSPVSGHLLPSLSLVSLRLPNRNRFEKKESRSKGVDHATANPKGRVDVFKIKENRHLESHAKNVVFARFSDGTVSLLRPVYYL